MYVLEEKKLIEIEETTFNDLGMKESDVEELLRQNVELNIEKKPLNFKQLDMLQVLLRFVQ